MTKLWIDASQGAAGDMLLAALLDAGASLDRVRAVLAGLDVEPVQVEVADVRRHGLRTLHAVLFSPPPPQAVRKLGRKPIGT